jgi:nicotinamide-nucleotide amidase
MAHVSGGRRAEIIAVGSELLTPSRVDTNSLHITERLNAIGVHVAAKAIVGDDRQLLAALVTQALDHADLLVVTGGLGPTDDDVTREAVCAALSLPMHEDEAIIAVIQRRFEARGLHMPDVNRRQGQVPEGAVVLGNPHGTAPGLLIQHGDRLVVLLPGPPREMRPMLDDLIATRLGAWSPGLRIYRRVLRIAGRTESHVEELAQPVYSRFAQDDPPVQTTILAAPGQIELHLSVSAAGGAVADAALGAATGALTEVLGPYVFSTDGRSLEQVVGDLLSARGLRLAIAESCTGGLIAKRLTDVPGSSAYLERGLVCYSNRSKVEVAGVPAALIDAHGAVSEPVAEALALGIRARAAVDIGVGLTGIAGPGGGSEAKPVGTVAIALAGPTDAVRVRTFRFHGDRDQVRTQAAQTALDMIRRVLSDR